MALWLPIEHRERLGPYLADCERRAPGFRWVRPEGLHLTLRFLGKVPEDRLTAVRQALAGVRATSFRMALGGLGSFGRPGASRVVWMGLADGGEAAADLSAAVELACREAALEPEERRLRPHVTLARARARGGQAVPELPPPPELEPWVADEIVLFESRVGPGPAEYVPLERYPLAG